MPPKKKGQDGGSKKAAKQKQEQLIMDRTFGLKNKAKSKQVQKYIKQVENNVKQASSKESQAAERRKTEKKNQKLLQMQADEEMRLLFSEATESDKKVKKQGKSKKDKAKEQAAGISKAEGQAKVLKDYPFIADEMLAMSGILNEMEPEELDAELANFIQTGTSDKLTLEQVIELQRAKMRADGVVGTPVTEESLAVWKAARAERRRAANAALVEAELKKKKGGKGLSILSGKDLFQYNRELFVDDEEADDEVYERRSDADEDEEEAGGEGHLGALDDRAAEDVDEAAGSGGPGGGAGGAAEEDDEPPPPPAAAASVAMDENLYLEGSDDDLEGLDDFSDDD